MTSDDFIDRLELELQAATRRRARLELARLPRMPTGAAVAVLAVLVSLAVALPLLGTRAGTAARHSVPPGGNAPGASVVLDCGHTISGQLPARWRDPGSGTVVTGPIAWLYVNRNMNRAAIARSHFIEAVAVVDPGRPVTVSIPASERRTLSLDYTDVSPRTEFRVSQGVSSVTFKPCSGRAASQFDGGFIVSRAQCAVINVSVVGGSTGMLDIASFGRGCATASEREKRVLKGDGIGPARFGEQQTTVARQLDALLRRRPSGRANGDSVCGIDHEIDWPGLEAYFYRRHFVGYSYGRLGTIRPGALATSRGLRVGDTVTEAWRIYGPAFRVGPAQGGSWVVRTRLGRLDGFLSDVTNPHGKVWTIEAGNGGCPALSP